MSHLEFLTDEESSDRAQTRAGEIQLDLASRMYRSKKDSAYANIAFSATDVVQNPSRGNKLFLSASKAVGKLLGLTPDEISEAERLGIEYAQDIKVIEAINKKNKFD